MRAQNCHLGAVLLFVTSLSLPALAQPEESLVPAWADLRLDPAPAGVVERHKYPYRPEMTLVAGIFPADPYHRALALAASLTFHLNERVALTPLSFSYAFIEPTALRRALLAQVVAQGLALPALPHVHYVAAMHAMLKPVYGKQALGETHLLRYEFYLLAGPAFVSAAQYEAQAFAAGLDLGAGGRLWVSERFSLRAGFSSVIYALSGTLHHALQTQVGIIFALGGPV